MGQPDAVAVDGQRHALRRELHAEGQPAGLDDRAARLDGHAERLAQVDRLQGEAQLVPGDARGVEQVVDEPDELRDLPLDAAAGRVEDLRVVRFHPQDFDGVQDRGEGVAEFVGQGRQELVLAAVGLAQPGVHGGQLGRPLADLSLEVRLLGVLLDRVADGPLEDDFVEPALFEVVGRPGGGRL